MLQFTDPPQEQDYPGAALVDDENGIFTSHLRPERIGAFGYPQLCAKLCG